MAKRDLVFFSYRHDEQGERWLSLILRWLEPYALAKSVVAWSDRDLRTGEQWDSRIQGVIDRARIAVVLVNGLRVLVGDSLGYVQVLQARNR